MSRVVINSENRITQKYKILTHRGVDIGHATKLHDVKNEIYPNCEGTVYEIVDNQVNNIKASGSKSWGNYVYIKHPNGMFSRYAHMETGIKVKVGDKVNENTLLGYIGNTGRSTARHLHFEVATKYSSRSRIDPTPYLVNPIYIKNDEEEKTYIMINAKHGVWCRKGAGFQYKKYRILPYKTKCILIDKNCKTIDGYKWDEVVYDGENVFIPNKWNKYL